jgi:hypothetical protein
MYSKVLALHDTIQSFDANSSSLCLVSRHVRFIDKETARDLELLLWMITTALTNCGVAVVVVDDRSMITRCCLYVSGDKNARERASGSREKADYMYMCQ